MPREVEPKPGDLLLITWKDFAGHGGDSSEAQLAYFVHCGFFKEWALDAEGEYVLITERNLHDGPYQKGWDTFPAFGIVKLEVVDFK